MQVRNLFASSLRYYWRTNLAVILGVAAATAVIGGAFVVGDSVRESLRQMSLDRLGRIDHAITGGRFFREQLAADLEQSIENSVVAPAILMQGTVELTKDKQTRRASQVQIIGTDEKLWSLLQTGTFKKPEAGEVVLNRRVADQLQIDVGDETSILIEIPAAIPRDSLLGDREETVTELVVTVAGLVEDEMGLARFGMNPSQQVPANAFVNLTDLQRQVGLAEVRPSKRNPEAKPGRVNSLFISTSDAIDARAAQRVSDTLASHLTLEDLSLRVTRHEDHGYISLESDQMILENGIAETAGKVAQDLGVQTSPVLVYLLNEMWNPNAPEKHSMYSVIAGVDPQATAPFGPFEFIGDNEPLQADAVYLNDWLAEDLDLSTGENVAVKYHVVGDRGELPEVERTLHVAGVVKLTGVADDTGYTPNVPGVTDAESYGEWRAPFPLKRELITDRDHLYWDNTRTEREGDYRTTPKLFTSLETAQNLWRSKYGELTSIRLAPVDGQTLDELSSQFTSQLLAKLKPTTTGLIVQPVKALGLQAAQGTTDFTGLFVGFSFFLILAATLLVGLLFRLGIETRISELGLLTAVGLTPRQVRWLSLGEGALLVVIGGILGLFAAVGYAALMIHGLKTWWIGAIGTKFLFLYVQPMSLISGLVMAAIVALVAIMWALWQTRHQSTRSLLNGETSADSALAKDSRRWVQWAAVTLIGGSLLLLLLTLTGLIPDVEAFGGFSWRVVMFFLVGFGMLMGGLFGLAAWLGQNEHMLVAGTGAAAQTKLGIRNASRNRSRSVMTTSLIASATFVIVAVAAGQMNPAETEPNVQSGNGGFTLVAETDIPILYDLNTTEGRSKLGLNVLDAGLMQTLDQAHVVPFRVRPGENASCLNLYQTQLPTVLAVPDVVLQDFIEKERFLFADTPSEKPWTLINGRLDNGNAPVLGDMNTLMYSLHKGIGKTINVPSDDNPEHTLQVVGMFANSVFQGVLVMSESNFREVFPDQVGFQYFLIEVPVEKSEEVSTALESNLGDYGFDAEKVSDRLTDFLAVQNTYLSTFQTLGGLGLLLGTIGLATVMLRNVLERRSELALMRAIGFRKSQIASLVVLENTFLLLCGLILGTVSALLAMSPHLLSAVADVPWQSLGVLLLAVFGVGMLSVLAAVRAAIATPILSTLRGE